MTIDELKKDSFFQQLTDGQKTFVTERCSGKEAVEAAKVAWKCTTDESAKAQARRALKNPGIKLLLGKFFNIGPNRCIPLREDLISVLWERVQRGQCEDADLHKMVMCIAELGGFRTKPADPAPPPAAPDDGDEEFAL